MILELQSKIPIYEQIVIQIKKEIREGRLRENDPLPSIRRLASDHKISALTVKKAYDFLEKEGIIVTVQGKGSFIAHIEESLILDELMSEVEKDLEKLLVRAKKIGLTREECMDLFSLVLEDVYA